MCWSDSGKNSLESTKKLIPLGTENMNLPGRDENCNESGKSMNVISVMSTENLHESCKDMSLIGKSKIEEELRAKGISDEHIDLLMKGSGALVLAPASDDNCCNTAKDNLEKGKNVAEEEIKTEGISDETLDFLIKAGAVVLLAGCFGGIGGACVYVLKFAAFDEDCREMAKSRCEKAKSWIEMAENGFEKSKSWAEEKIRAAGISDERRDLLLKCGGTLLGAAAAAGCFSKLGGACRNIFRGGSSNDDEKLMKAPGRPGEYIKRAVFEANPKAYFRDLRGKLP